jgi:hypothetical protein
MTQLPLFASQRAGDEALSEHVSAPRITTSKHL